MSPGMITSSDAAIGFPRVSGDEPYVDQVRADLDAFSPREWG